MSDRDAFLRAIARDENEISVRLAYADWLDNHGEHEEAERQRNLPEAKRWLQSLCDQLNTGREEYPPIVIDQLLDFGRAAAAINSVDIEVYRINYCAAIVTAIREQIPAFWNAWSIVTGLPLSPGVQDKCYFESGFCCINEVYRDTHVAGPISDEFIRRSEEYTRRKEWTAADEAEAIRQEEEAIRQVEEEVIRKEEETRQNEFDAIQDQLEQNRP